MYILRSKTARLVTTAVLTLGAAGAALAAGTAPADAAVRPNYKQCSYNGSGTCTALSSAATFYSPSNVAKYTLPSGENIEVTCWYLSGGAGDGYYDHVSWTYNKGNVDGHVLDNAVNLGGNTPPQVGIPQC